MPVEQIKQKRRQNKDDIFRDIGQKLTRKAYEQANLRHTIEQRWLADAAQYHGQYTGVEREKLKKQKEETGSSDIFVNITRSKTDAAEARLSEMLFPTDDRNWGIKPTPKPDLQNGLNDQSPALDALGNPLINDDNQQLTESDIAKLEMDEAKKRAEGMQDEIDDQLNEGKYNQVARDIIRDAVRFGTGILKGPITINRFQRSWKQLDGVVFELEVSQDKRPGLRRVDPWNFFPDMTAARIEDADFVFERIFATKKQLRDMAKQPGMEVAQIKRLLSMSPMESRQTSGSNQQELRQISGLDSVVDDNRYELWEYSGPLMDDLIDVAGLDSDRDVLKEQSGTVLLSSSGLILRSSLSNLETEDAIFSVFNWIESEASIFGFGIPYVMRASSEITNKTWRAMLDNAALSVGPQIIVDPHAIQPADGHWGISQRKIWKRTRSSASTPINQSFHVVNIDSHQPQLQAIYEIAKQLADEETNMPAIAQGDAGDTPIQTLGQTSILMNASNSGMRRIVKNWDDGITSTFIRRMYDYNMQHSEDESIKGDFEVDARGTSALMVKETQTAALLSLMEFAGHPVFGPLTKAAALYRKTVEAQRIAPDEVIKTDDELKAEQADAQQAPSIDQQKLALEQQKLQQEKDLKSLEMQFKEVELILKHELTQEQLDAKLQEASAKAVIEQEKIIAKQQETAMKVSNDQDQFDTEVALKITEGSGI